MKVGTIVTQVAAGLPQVSAILVKDGSVPDGGASYKVLHASTSSTVDVENDYLEQPIGTVIREYSLEKTSMSLSTSGGISYPSSTKGTRGDFVMTLADMRTDWEARRYHDEVEKISHWFIEIASCVEVGQTGGIEADGGYWKVLYLFEKHRIGGAPKYSFVGYVTLYFHGQTMTVCQAVCLPPYQRSGHGTEMLMTAYDCNDSREILVESPAPAFGELPTSIIVPMNLDTFF
jgi:histone acetyltransferase 1